MITGTLVGKQMSEYQAKALFAKLSYLASQQTASERFTFLENATNGSTSVAYGCGIEDGEILLARRIISEYFTGA